MTATSGADQPTLRDQLAEEIVQLWADDAGEDVETIWGLGAALDESLKPYLDRLLPVIEADRERAKAEALEEAASAMSRPSEGAPYGVWAHGGGDWLRVRAAKLRGPA